MSKINQIQQAIIALSPGAYQKLMDEYLVKKYHFDNIHPYGSHTGTDKTTRGTPDSYVRCSDGKYILIEHGSVEKSFQKVKEDILDCLKPEKTKIPIEDIKQIICCHTSTNFSAGQTSELYSLFDNIIIIGLGDVSYDLLNKYQSLAYDHLHIALDTHQFFDLDGFIKEYGKNSYSTSLDMPLLGRDDDLSALANVLSTENVIVLSGASGIGKTRLAIEAAQRYASSHNANMLVIKSNGESIYSDCSSYIDNDKENIIVVDDANELVQIRHLLSLALDNERPFAIKLLLTVRDYAKQPLFSAIDQVTKPQSIELQPLSGENIEKILNEIFQITNRDILDQILSIAKGNARLAVMAANCVKAKEFSSIRNAIDLFNGYYTPIISELDRQELLVASLVALFDAVSLTESALPVIIAEKKGISYPQFVEHCKMLHGKEVVNLLDNRAVRFDNQNLRDYLLNYIFFQEKSITPTEIIDLAFPKYRTRIVFALTTLLHLFNSPENVVYIEGEIRNAWSIIKNRDDESQKCFIESFSSVIPDESLLFIKQQIDALQEYHLLISAEKHRTSPNPNRYYSEWIKLLSNFKEYDCFEDAIALAIRHLERNSEHPTDFYILFGDTWGFEYRSARNRYKNESLLIDKLLDYYRTLPSDRSALCLYSFIKENMQYSFSCTEETDERTIRFITFHLPACEEVYNIRHKCLEGLFLLYASPLHQKWADQILSGLFSTHSSDEDAEIVQRDIEAFSKMFSSSLSTTNMSHCNYLRQIHHACKDSNIPYPANLPKHTENRIYTIYTVLSENYIFKYRNSHDADALRLRDIEELCATTTTSEFEQLWKALSSPPLDAYGNDWEVGNGINLIFQCLKGNRESFFDCVSSYLAHKAPLALYCDVLIDGLISYLGFEESERFLRAFDFDYRNQWITKIYNRIPSDQIDESVCSRILSIKDQLPETIAPIHYETAQRVNAVKSTFLKEYLIILIEKANSHPALLSNFLRPLTHKEKQSTTELLHIFEQSLDILCNAYILALRGDLHFDYAGDLFLALVEKDSAFIPTVVSELVTERHSTSDTGLLNALWRSANYAKLITIAMDALRTADVYSYYAEVFGHHFMSKSLENKDHAPKVTIWLNEHITEFGKDMSRMKFLFNILCNCQKDIFFQGLVSFCHVNQSFDDFKSLRLTETSRSWSGSEIPLIDKQLDFLDNLRTQLKGIDYAEHRAWISEWIQNARNYRSRIEAEEFMDRT